VDYEERLWVPLRWWVQGTMLLATFWLAFIVSLPAAAAWVATGVLASGLVAFLWSYGAARVRVSQGRLVAGRAQVEDAHLADSVALDRETTRRIAGVDADARAYLLLRPYLKRAVRVDLADPRDPTPYWLVSSRRPEELARALRRTTGRLTSDDVTQED